MTSFLAQADVKRLQHYLQHHNKMDSHTVEDIKNIAVWKINQFDNYLLGFKQGMAKLTNGESDVLSDIELVGLAKSELNAIGFNDEMLCSMFGVLAIPEKTITGTFVFSTKA
ncbi:MAG: hypothetical protein V7L23_31660 [Nostoc sp.]|uniref:hypothetical protein n=1 Tax=Nostoc sp. TaxID=1180 RepID=UPI002FEFC65A